MLLVTSESIAGYEVTQVMGLVHGNSVRAKHVGRDFMAGLKQIVGGELRGYTELLSEARREAIARMVQEAERLGANAIISMRFNTSSIMASAAELFAFGTAVVVQPTSQSTAE